ncbi:MAG: hypothetical protein R3B46_10090 [Phycisphaerales bacterium]
MSAMEQARSALCSTALEDTDEGRIVVVAAGGGATMDAFSGGRSLSGLTDSDELEFDIAQTGERCRGGATLRAAPAIATI